MGYEFKCRDVGMNCGFEVRADRMEDLMPVLEAHAKHSHGMEKIPPDMMEKAKAAIKQF
ncbi:DUF1059 domain-containing protein [Picrophilus oshimae]|uniref:Hypothetical archaeal protein n=1 Tax=Picrophilus torridus (strain ATCC 700027 / DSM 9790 / JCM 10055 / NBRC 100828 / KAW 2/3) TaxID=1122961 RepID=Q6L0L6_PICTO|nr:DUF1059 domain-containing protein [Picrophilus oshimae]AAT43486.1 hypothetical archaeal protein [Picrophilus oshimae DSM 9789]SMD30205.1 Predicted small metal-binding protein [Picrophilus oshimae DSM 9789]